MIDVDKKYPFVVIAISFVLGILLMNFVDESIHYSKIFWIRYIAFAVSISLIIMRFMMGASLRKTKNIILPLAVFFCALGVVDNSNNSNITPNYYKNLIVKIVDVEQDSSKAKVVAKIIYKENEQHLNPNKLIVYLKKSNSEHFLPQDILLLKGGVQIPILPPKNPNVFNYKNYLSKRNITSTIYPKSWSHIVSKNNLSIKRWAYIVNQKCATCINSYIANPIHASICKGLLLGSKTEIPQDMLQVFAQSGLMHLLSVSGFHVGLIYLIVNFLLSFLFVEKKKTQWSKFLILIAIIWIFAFISGLSAAVIRAALLFTFLQMGKLIAQKGQMLNLLAATAFFLLLYNPNYVYDIGFQLSYLAMIGIILTYKPIYDFFFIKNYFLDKIWQTSAMAISAMLLTTPLSIYYFGNFPLYFLITNIYSGIVAFVIIIGTILLLLLSPFYWLANILAKILSIIIQYGFIYPTEKITSLPFGKLDMLFIDEIQLFLLLFAALLLLLYFVNKNPKRLMASLGIIVFTIIISYYTTYKSLLRSHIIAYSVSKNHYLGIKNGLNMYIFSDDSINSNKNLSFNVKPSLRLWHCKLKNQIPLDKGLHRLIYQKDTILINTYYKNKLGNTTNLLCKQNGNIVYKSSKNEYNISIDGYKILHSSNHITIK
jgi:competence protein ComEC